MSKKKRPKKPLAAPPQVPVMHGKLFATFLQEASSIGNECEARRAFDREVGLFLAERGLTAEFEAWRQARAPRPS